MSVPAVPDPPTPARQPRRPTGVSVNLDAEGRRRRARVAANRRHHPDQPEQVLEDHRALREAAAERTIRELVSTWPPLSAEQRRRLAVLLTAPDGDGAMVEGAGDG